MVVVVISFVSFNYSSKVLKDAIEKELQAVLEATISKIETLEHVYEGEMEMLTNQQTMRIYDKAPESNVRNIFRDFKDYNEGKIESIVIIDLEGHVFIDSENKRLKDQVYGDNPAFIDALAGMNSWTDVMVSPITEENIIIGMVPIFDSEGNVHGVIGTTVYFSEIKEIIDAVKIGKEGYAYAVGSDMITVAHPDPNYIGSNLQDVGVPELTEAVVEMGQGKSGVVEYTFMGNKKTNYYTSSGRLSVSVNAAEDDYLSPLKTMGQIQLWIGLIFFAIGAVISIISGSIMVKKIKKIQQAMNLVAEGDLTAQVQLKTSDQLDEVGQIGVGMNKMLDSMKSMIDHIKISSESLATASEQLSASADQNRIASEETTNSMQEIAEGAERQVNVMIETSELFEVVNRKMEASSIEAISMADKSEEVKDTASKGQVVITESKSIMDDVKTLSVEAVEAIAELNAKSDQITDINSMISQIADQTNLLALNAAIEAARAGEQGKGFAVVADEIRKLAAQSQQSAQGIQRLIVEMQEKVSEASKLIQSENKKVDEGIDSVEDSRNAFVQINDTIVGVVEHIDEVVKSINDTIESTDKVNSAIEEVVSIVHETSASSEAIAASSEEQMAVSQEISSSATQLAQMAEDLLQAVIVFKTE